MVRITTRFGHLDQMKPCTICGLKVCDHLFDSSGRTEESACHFDPGTRQLVGAGVPLPVPAFVPPFIADDQAFDDSAAQLANRADRSAPVSTFIHEPMTSAGEPR